MSDDDHECEFEEIVAGLEVTLHVDLIRPLCPQYDNRMLRVLIQKYAEPIAAQMVSAGLSAAVQLFNADGGTA